MLAAACGGGSGGSEGTVVVFAAASLSEPFRELGRRFEEVRPDLAVRFNFAGSSALVSQLDRGARADVLATADARTYERAAGAGLAGPGAVFARNRLVIAVEPGNPRRVRDLAGLARGGLTVVLCAAEVPCGRAADEALARAGVDVRPRSREADVKAVVAKVALGEADAGLVYVTDVRAAGGDVDGVALDGAAAAVTTDYVIGPVAADAGAHAFVAFVRAAESGRVLAGHGFLPAEGTGP